MKQPGGNAELCSCPVYVFYDEVCAACSWAVRFLLARPRARHFRFVSLQALSGSPVGDYLEREVKIPNLSTVVVWKNGVFASYSDAIFLLLAELGRPWTALRILRVLPKAWRDDLYKLFARYRYRLFGKVDPTLFCQVLPEHRDLFLSHFPEDLLPPK